MPPQPANDNPVITSLDVTDFGVSGLTPIAMSVAATDEDNDPLTYTWSFLGRSVGGTSTTTVFSGDGPETVTVAIRDSKGGATSASRTVNVGTMTGRWRWVPTNGPTCGYFGFTNGPILTLTQVDRTVTGDLSSPVAWCNVPAGQTGRLDPGAPARIDEQGNFTARLKIGAFLDTFMTAKMDSTGRELTGSDTFQSSNAFGTFWLRKF